MPSISEKMQNALNGQITAELYSSHLYLAMSAYFDSLDLPGFAMWMRVQSKEENLHVQKLFDYISERGGRVFMDAVDKPPFEWKNPLDAFQAAYDHEQKVSDLINQLATMATEINDRATESFLRWYIDEQVEEEASVDKVVKMLRLADNQPTAMLMIDRDLATRVYAPPPELADAGAGA